MSKLRQQDEEREDLWGYAKRLPFVLASGWYFALRRSGADRPETETGAA